MANDATTSRLLLPLALAACLVASHVDAQTQVNRITTKSATPSQWLRSLDVSGNTSVFTSSQPDFSDLSGTISAPFVINAQVSVNTNAQLAALSYSYAPVVVRLGYTTAGDAPPVLYTRSNSACSLNAGAGDGGSQVPTSDGKCWLGTFPTNKIDVRQFGASNTVASDATSAIQAAINYAGTLASSGTYTGAVVHLPAGEYLISSTLTISNNNVTIEGDGKGITIIARNAAFADTIRANNNGQIENISVRHLTLYHDTSLGNAMTGAHVNFIGVARGTVDDVNTINGLIGIELQGGVYLTVKNTHIQGTYVSGSTPKNGLSGLWITAAPSLNVSGGAVLLPAIVNITETQINASSADAGWQYGHLINAAEEVHFSNSTFNGSYYAQGYIQQTASNYDILEITYANCFFDGGSTPSVGPWFGLWVDGSAGNGSAVISRITIDGTSFNGEGLTPNGGSFGNGIYVDGTNRGGAYPQAVGSLQMNGGRIQGWYSHGADVEGGTNLSFNGVHVYSNNTSVSGKYGIKFGATASKFSVMNSMIGGIFGITDSQAYGIGITNGAADFMISGNDLSSNTIGALADSSAATNKRITNNLGFNGNRAAVSPSIPATTVDFTNPYGSPAVVSIFGGTVSSIKLNGQQIYGASDVVVIVGANDVLNLTYTVAPSWIWWPQ